MKKAILLTLILALSFSGCGNREGSEDGTPSAEKVPTLNEVAHSTAEQKAAYYQAQNALLEQELLALKAELHALRTAYEAQIDALEAALYPEEAEKLFQYTVANGRATVVRYIGNGSTVVIPATLGGAPVAAIADRAFENQDTLTSVILPEGVRYVGWFAFSGCTALVNVRLPASLSLIEYGAFQKCPSTVTFACPAGSYAEKYAESYGFAVE